MTLPRVVRGHETSRPCGARPGRLHAAGARAGEQRLERDRCECATIDADVELARQRLETSMAVTMEIDRATMRAVPGSKRIVAQNKPGAAERELGVILHAR